MHVCESQGRWGAWEGISVAVSEGRNNCSADGVHQATFNIFWCTLGVSFQRMTLLVWHDVSSRFQSNDPKLERNSSQPLQALASQRGKNFTFDAIFQFSLHLKAQNFRTLSMDIIRVA